MAKMTKKKNNKNDMKTRTNTKKKIKRKKIKKIINDMLRYAKEDCKKRGEGEKETRKIRGSEAWRKRRGT